MAEGDGRLALDEPDMRLPWLEAADDEGDDANDGLDWRRIRRFAAFLALALLVLALAIWLATVRITAPPPGDGSVIEAPDTPYKVRPEDPGGIRLKGTGDSAFLIGEGVEQRARLAKGESIAADDVEAASDSEAEAETAQLGAKVAVQVGAYSTPEDARSGWQKLTRRYEPLGDFDHRIVEGNADIGIVHRLQAIASSRDAAFALCDDLRDNGIECQVKR